MPESNLQPSFIPHDADLGMRRRSSPAGIVDFAALIAIVLFVASAALAIGVYLYQGYIQTSEVSKADQLERAKAAFEPSLIKDLTRLDDRMNSASKILTNHIAPSAFFHMLERTTISSLGFTGLTFDGTDRGNESMKMTGIANSVNSVALQADLFGKGGILTNPIFSDIDRHDDGVHFQVTGTLNQSALNYVHIVENGQTQQLLPRASTTTPSLQPTQGAQPTGATQGSSGTGGGNNPGKSPFTPPQNPTTSQ